MAWSDPVDATVGQRILSAAVDLAFFAVLGFCAVHDKLHENAILVLLTVYAQGRFYVAGQKQNAGTISNIMGGPPSGGSMRPPGGGTGTSTPRMAAVAEPIATTPPVEEAPRPGPPRPRRDDRRDYRISLPSSPIVYLVTQLVRRSRPALGLAIALVAVLLYGCIHVTTSHDDSVTRPRRLRIADIGMHVDGNSQERSTYRDR